MTQIILILVGIAIVVILMSRKTRQQVVGICAAAMGLDVKKRQNKEKILTLLAKQKELSNSDIRQTLGVSDRTIIRYMDELEKDGKVIQVGNTGRAVTYRLK